MTDPASLENVPTRFEGIYRPSEEDGPDAAPIAVYEGTLSEGDGPAKVYRFRRVKAIGDEFDFDGQESLTVGVENIHREDGHIVGSMAVAASSPEGITDSPVVFRDDKEFRHLLEKLTHADHLDMERRLTTLSPEGTRMLGFSATAGGDVLSIDLHDDQEVAATA